MSIKLEGYKKEILDELRIPEMCVEEVVESDNDVTVIYIKGAVFNYPYNSLLLRRYKVSFSGINDMLTIKIRG